MFVLIGPVYASVKIFHDQSIFPVTPSFLSFIIPRGNDLIQCRDVKFLEVFNKSAHPHIFLHEISLLWWFIDSNTENGKKVYYAPFVLRNVKIRLKRSLWRYCEGSNVWGCSWRNGYWCRRWNRRAGFNFRCSHIQIAFAKGMYLSLHLPMDETVG